MERTQPSASNLMGASAAVFFNASNSVDTHNRLVADILTRYRTLMMQATNQADGDTAANPETTAVTGISMKMEFEGLVGVPKPCEGFANVQYASIKEMLTLSRKLKELWVFGPLGEGDPDRKAKEAQVEQDVAGVTRLLNALEEGRMKALATEHGGSWESLTRDEKA